MSNVLMDLVIIPRGTEEPPAQTQTADTTPGPSQTFTASTAASTPAPTPDKLPGTGSPWRVVDVIVVALLIAVAAVCIFVKVRMNRAAR